MNGHSTAQLDGFTRLQLRINWVMDHHRRRHIWQLRGVPFGFRLIQLGWQGLVKPPIIDGTF